MKTIYRQRATELKLHRRYEYLALLQLCYLVARLVAHFGCYTKPLKYNNLQAIATIATK